MKELILASENKNKIKEAQEIFTEYKIIPISEFKIKFDVEEDGETFKQNAEKKAKTVAEQLNGKACIADDSGIEIEYLNGFPGVKTKRWFNGTDRERNLAIIEKLIGVPKEKRKDLDWMIDANFENWAENYSKEIKILEKAKEQ